MEELIIKRWNWNNGTDFANWMTKQVAYKVLSEFRCWYSDIEKAVSTMDNDEQEPRVRRQVLQIGVDGLMPEINREKRLFRVRLEFLV